MAGISPPKGGDTLTYQEIIIIITDAFAKMVVMGKKYFICTVFIDGFIYKETIAVSIAPHFVILQKLSL